MGKNNYKPYTAKRWTEPIKPVPLGTSVVFDDEQKAQNDTDFEHILREYDVIKPDETVKNGKVIKKDTT